MHQFAAPSLMASSHSAAQAGCRFGLSPTPPTSKRHLCTQADSLIFPAVWAVALRLAYRIKTDSNIVIFLYFVTIVIKYNSLVYLIKQTS
jgi:hypothetical protein